jgi:aminocarboxymuconate-semialdehyde decarboxylase
VIDLHAHHWPDALLSAISAGRSWFGWEGVRLSDGSQAIALGGRVLRFTPPPTDLADLPSRLERRAREGIRGEAVMPVGFLWGDHLGAAEAAAFCLEINGELAETQAAAPDRFRGIGILPLHAPDRIDEVLDEAVRSGLTAVAVSTNVRGRNLDEPDLVEVLEGLVARDLAIFVHPTYLESIASDRLPRYYFSNTLGAPLESAVALLSLIQAGFFERQPDARIIFANGGGCAPYEIGRLRRRYQTRADCRTTPRSPDEYLRSAHYDSLVLDSETLRLLVRRVGADRVSVGTDFPFHSDVPEGAVAWISAQEWLTEAERSAILHGNAERFLAHRMAVHSTMTDGDR